MCPLVHRDTLHLSSLGAKHSTHMSTTTTADISSRCVLCYLCYIIAWTRFTGGCLLLCCCCCWRRRCLAKCCWQQEFARSLHWCEQILYILSMCVHTCYGETTCVLAVQALCANKYISRTCDTYTHNHTVLILSHFAWTTTTTTTRHSGNHTRTQNAYTNAAPGRNPTLAVHVRLSRVQHRVAFPPVPTSILAFRTPGTAKCIASLMIDEQHLVNMTTTRERASERVNVWHNIHTHNFQGIIARGRPSANCGDNDTQRRRGTQAVAASSVRTAHEHRSRGKHCEETPPAKPARSAYHFAAGLFAQALSTCAVISIFLRSMHNELHKIAPQRSFPERTLFARSPRQLPLPTSQSHIIIIIIIVITSTSSLR